MKKYKFENITLETKTNSKLTNKNNELIKMVVERAKRDFPEDIALIGLTGSFSTGNFHEKSDLDLIIINNTAKGQEITYEFIFDDVGYDFYCNSWQRIEDAIENCGITSIIDWQVFYYSKPEYLDRFNALKAKARENLKKPIGKDCLNRAYKHICLIKQHLSETFLSEDIGEVRYASGYLLDNAITTLVRLNNSYIKRGIRRDMAEILAFRYLPDDFGNLYMAVINAKTVDEIRISSSKLTQSILQIYDTMMRDLVETPTPTYENLRGTYEECWCNYRNKLINAAAIEDSLYAFNAAINAQVYFDEMTETRGTKKFNLLKYFDPDNLDVFKDVFFEAMEEYRAEYDKVGRKVQKFDTFEELYNHYMRGNTKNDR